MTALMLTFVLLLWRILHVSEVARDTLGQALAVGIAGMIFFQAFVNIGVVLGALPVLGVPLPLVSAGGSALLTTMAAIGIVLSFARRRPEPIAPPPPPAPVRRAR